MSESYPKSIILVAIVVLAVAGVMSFMQFSAVSAESIQAADSNRVIAEDSAATGNWVFTAIYTDSHLVVINTANDMVYGPFLEGQLGQPYDYLEDLVVTSDYQTLLISNYREGSIHFVDISNPISPTWMYSVAVGLPAEDIALGYGERYAFVTGDESSLISVIDMIAPTNVYTYLDETREFGGVAIAPDGTIVVSDYTNSSVYTYLFLDATHELSATGSYSYLVASYLSGPINVEVAPDGETVIVCDDDFSALGVFRITEPGKLTFTEVITGLVTSIPDPLAGAVGSVSFNEAGNRIYAPVYRIPDLSVSVRQISGNREHDGIRDVQISLLPDRLSVLEIVNPGDVQVLQAEAAILPRDPQFGSFSGIDTIVTAGDKLYIGYPANSIFRTADYLNNPVVVVELDDYSTYPLTVTQSGNISFGLAQTPIQVDISKTVDTTVANPGEIVNYTVVLTNQGAWVGDLVLTDMLPVDLEFVGPVTIDPPTAGAPGTELPVIADAITLPADGVVTVTYPVRLADVTIGDVLTNSVTLASSQIRNPGKAEASFLVDLYKIFMGLIEK